MHVLRLRIVGDLGVRGVVASFDTEVVGGHVAGGEFRGLPASYAVVGAGLGACDSTEDRINTAVSGEGCEAILAWYEPTLLGVRGIIQDIKDAAGGSVGYRLKNPSLNGLTMKESS